LDVRLTGATTASKACSGSRFARQLRVSASAFCTGLDGALSRGDLLAASK